MVNIDFIGLGQAGRLWVAMGR